MYLARYISRPFHHHLTHHQHHGVITTMTITTATITTITVITTITNPALQASPRVTPKEGWHFFPLKVA
jgi:hypothetical protein